MPFKGGWGGNSVIGPSARERRLEHFRLRPSLRLAARPRPPPGIIGREGDADEEGVSASLRSCFVAVGVAAVGAFAGLLVGSAIIFFFGLVLVAVVGTHIYALTLVLGPLITGATTMAAALAVAWQPRTSRTSTVTCLGIASGIGTLLYLLPGGTGDLRQVAEPWLWPAYLVPVGVVGRGLGLLWTSRQTPS